MKRTIFVLSTILVVFLIVLAVLVVRPLRTVKAHHGCSERTLLGDYGWSEFGSDTEDNPTPTNFWTFTGLVHFDGNGNFSISDAYEVDDGAHSGPYSASGTYTVNSNCTMTITYVEDAVTYYDNGVIVDANGGEVFTSEYGPAPGTDVETSTTGHVTIRKIGDSD